MRQRDSHILLHYTTYTDTAARPGFDVANFQQIYPIAHGKLAGALLKSIETHVYHRLGLLRSHRRSRKTDGTFVIDEEERGCLLGVAKVGEGERELN